MNGNFSFMNNKKSAFTYLELIISMSLIVIVTLLTTPFLVAVSRTKVNAFGEFKCYARYVDGEWKLFQNQRLNSNSYPIEDTLINNAENACEFPKPSGNISSYTITLYGGGGSGSAPYYDYSDSYGIRLAPGQDGQPGEQKIITDDLNRAFADDNVLRIKMCNDPTVEIDMYGRPKETCIGIGGDVNRTYNYSYAREERINEIINNLAEGGLNESDMNYILNLATNSSALYHAYLAYTSQNGQTIANKINLISSLQQNVSVSETGKNTGRSGGSTQVVVSTGQIATAEGGKYGISDKYINNGIYNKTNMTNLENNIYYIPANISPGVSGSTYTNCDGNNANRAADSAVFENFGAAGKAGGFICNIAGDNYNSVSFNSQNHAYSNSCHSCLGGMGAGGAIIIQWN